MTANVSLEERVAAVEVAIAELQQQVQLVNPQPTNWVEEVSGSFKDKPAFEEVLAYGRAIRQGDDSGASHICKKTKKREALRGNVANLVLWSVVSS